MQGPFPDELAVPYGTTHTRLIWGLLPWLFGLLLLVGIGPVYLWGWRKWWVSLLAVVAGILLAQPLRDDPEYLEGLAGEMQLKDWYE